MGYDFPFTIADIAGLLPINNQRVKAKSIDADCPFCGRKNKFNMNFVKNVYKCNVCSESGGMIDLYMKFNHNVSDRSEAYRAICEDLRIGKSSCNNLPKQTFIERTQIPESKLAPDFIRHATYAFLFELLTLSPKHKQDLIKRGLTEEQIEEYAYKSTPAFGFNLLAKEVIDNGFTVQGVPGFYIDNNGNWTVNFHAKSSGLIIPVIGIDGKIQGAQIRLDRPFKGRKYMWFSSSEKNMGTPVGSPIHFVGNLKTETICVTEGGLKGTVAHCLSGRTFACIAGAGQYQNFISSLPALKSFGVEEIQVAYDMDLLTNEDVMRGCLKILCAARDAGFIAKLRKWNPVNKGIDDHYWARKLKDLLASKLSYEFKNTKQTQSRMDLEILSKLSNDLKQSELNVRTLTWLFFMELPLRYIQSKAKTVSSFDKLMSSIEKDIPKDF